MERTRASFLVSPKKSSKNATRQKADATFRKLADLLEDEAAHNPAFADKLAVVLTEMPRPTASDTRRESGGDIGTNRNPKTCTRLK